MVAVSGLSPACRNDHELGDNREGQLYGNRLEGLHAGNPLKLNGTLKESWPNTEGLPPILLFTKIIQKQTVFFRKFLPPQY